MTINEYRRQWLRWHRIYERRAYLILRTAMINALRNIPTDQLNETNYEIFVRESISRDEFLKAYNDIYTTIGLQHGNRIVRDIERQAKSIFTDNFNRDVRTFLLRFAGTRITSVTESLADFILKEIAKGRESGKTISEIVTAIIKRRSLYRSQLLRIARTETTAAAGYASDVASSSSGIVMEKVWVSAQDGRTRRVPSDAFDHLHLNLMRVPDGEPFEVPTKSGGVELLRFPADPNGSVGNTANCRCSIIKVVKRDENGNIVRR